MGGTRKYSTPAAAASIAATARALPSLPCLSMGNGRRVNAASSLDEKSAPAWAVTKRLGTVSSAGRPRTVSASPTPCSGYAAMRHAAEQKLAELAHVAHI